MRKLKFRLWDSIENKMYFNQKKVLKMMSDFSNNYSHFKSKSIKVDEYTELKDKYGVDIYENDLVEYYGKVYKVIFNEWSFGWLDGNCFYSFYEMSYKDLNKLKVVGNIYENGNLLEK